MLYRDFMSKYRPLLAPDGPAAGGGGAEPAVGAAAPAAGESSPAGASHAADASAGDGAAAAGSGEAAAADAGAGDAAAAVDGAGAKDDQTLLEAAEGKKPAADAAAGDNKDPAASGDAAKPEGETKPEGDGKDAAADKDKGADDKSKPEAGKDAAADDKTAKDATAEAQPPAPIKYEAFKLPEGVKFDDERFAKFTDFAGQHQVSQDVAQGLVDLHVAEMQNLEQSLRQQQQDVWRSLNDGWKAELRKDAQLGGNRIDTNLSMAKAVLEEYGGSPEQVSELLSHTKANGMGNYPGFIRLLVNIGEALNVFEEGTVAGDTSPPKPQRGAGNRGWYDKSNMNGGAPKA